MTEGREGSIHVNEGDGRREYVRPSGAPKPPPEIWGELEAAGATGDDYRFAVAHARYLAWLSDVHGIHEGLHGSEAPEVP